MDPRATKDAAAKVLYEWEMFEWCGQEAAKKHAHRGMKNSLLESFLIHARVLYDFFVTPATRDDISAQHFFDDPNTWANSTQNLCPYLRSERIRLQGMVPHLTYRRLDYERAGQKEWDVSAVTKDISQAWQQFLSALPKDRAAWFTR